MKPNIKVFQCVNGIRLSLSVLPCIPYRTTMSKNKGDGGRRTIRVKYTSSKERERHVIGHRPCKNLSVANATYREG